jgi:hypothetical protein
MKAEMSGAPHLHRPTRPQVRMRVYACGGLMTTYLAGSERVRRHLRRRPRSVPHNGVSDGPGAYRVPVPIAFIVSDRSGRHSSLIKRRGQNDGSEIFQKLRVSICQKAFDIRLRE